MCIKQTRRQAQRMASAPSLATSPAIFSRQRARWQRACRGGGRQEDNGAVPPMHRLRQPDELPPRPSLGLTGTVWLPKCVSPAGHGMHRLSDACLLVQLTLSRLEVPPSAERDAWVVSAGKGRENRHP